MAILPQTGLSVSAVRTAIQHSSFDVGTLCKSPNINKWSKYKPVIYPTNNTDGYANWWKAIDGKCGLSVEIFTNLGNISNTDSFLYKLKNNIVKWDRVPPYGGAASPYRLGDFRNYKDDAIAPIKLMDSYNVYVSSTGTIQVDADVLTIDNYNLSLTDIEHNGDALNTYYLGVLLFKNNSSSYILATSTSRLNSESFSVTLSDMSGNTGSWKMAFFLSSVIISQTGNTVAGVYIPLDLPITNLTINGYGTLYSIIAQGVWNSYNNIVNYDLYLSNKNSTALTINNIVAQLRYTTGTQEPSASTLVSSYTIGSQTIAANSDKTLTGYTFSHTKVANRTYWLTVTATGMSTTYTQIEDYAGMVD